MPYKTASRLLLLLGCIALEPHVQAQTVTVLEACRQAMAPLAGQLAEIETTSPSTASVLKILLDDSVCTCTERRLKANGVEVPENTEKFALGFMRANTDCQIENFRTFFPLRCPEIYGQLLPAIGYDNPSAEFIGQACTCVEGAMDKHASADQVYASGVARLKRGVAAANDRRTGRRTADNIQLPPEPFSVAMIEAKACVASHAQKR